MVMIEILMDNITTLADLAKAFIDNKIKGNQDQIVTNFIYKKFSTLPEMDKAKKALSAMRDFSSYKQTILRRRSH